MVTNASPGVRAVLVSFSLASTAIAGADGLSSPELPEGEDSKRAIFLFSEDPGSRPPDVLVTPGEATVLRFARPFDFAWIKRQAALGWLEIGTVSEKGIYLKPLRSIWLDGRLPFSVKFLDGTEIFFILKTVVGGERPDKEVWFFASQDSPEALWWQMADYRRKWRLSEAQRLALLQEALSTDHALAGLLVGGAINQTLFVPNENRTIEVDGVAANIRLLRGKEKAAVLVQLTNKGIYNQKLFHVRLSMAKTGEARPFALRFNREEIAPASTGTMAIVVDRGAFMSANRPVALELKLYHRDGTKHTSITLDPRLAGP
jgi:hypothetical protein